MTTPEYELLAKAARPTQQGTHANIPVVEESEAAGSVAEAYEYFRAHFGRRDVPGILKCFSSSPALMQAIMSMSSTLLFSDGYLGRRCKEMIASYVSKQNDCPYCLDSHAFFLRVHGGGEAAECILEDRLDSSSITPAERELLEFVRKVNGESHRITHKDIANMRTAGWTDEQIAEVVHLAAAFAFFNRVANGFGLPSQGLLTLDMSSLNAPVTGEQVPGPL
jgi:uncharacterized peroxidase-related enzyme